MKMGVGKKKKREMLGGLAEGFPAGFPAGRRRAVRAVRAVPLAKIGLAHQNQPANQKSAKPWPKKSVWFKCCGGVVGVSLVGGSGGRPKGAAGTSHDSPRAQTCTFQGPGLQNTKIQRKRTNKRERQE